MQRKIIVSGFPRSGTAMMMHILEKGGLKVIKDNRKPANEDNPNGFYEYRGMEHFPEWWLEAEGDCLKILIPQINRINGDHKIIFMQRNLQEVITSLGEMQDAAMWACGNLLGEVRRHLKDKDVTYLNYNGMMENPRMELEKIKDLIPDFEEALKVVNPKLHRIKMSSGKLITKEELERKKKWLKSELGSAEKLLKFFQNDNHSTWYKRLLFSCKEFIKKIFDRGET